MIVDEIIGIYNADGSLMGELRFVVGWLAGRAHCALCDITHSLVREKGAFKATRERYALRTLHRDEQPADLARFTAGRTPCVVARTAEGYVELMDGAALAACAKSVDRFEAALEAALDANDLQFASGCG